MHVLVTDDSYKAALGIVRSLGSKGIRVSVLADSSKVLASRSRYCSARYEVPNSGEPTFFAALVDLLRRIHFDLVMPVGYTLTAALARHKAELNSLSRLEVANYEEIVTAADKHHVQSLAASLGVPVPRTIAPNSFDDVVKLSSELQFPVVIKAPCEAPGEPVYYPRSRSELLLQFRSICERRNGSKSRLPLVQEYIPGFGCGFFALYQHGSCRRVFMHRRIRETPPSGGVSCCAESFYDSKLKLYGTRLLDRLGWHGVAMVEFRYDQRDGDYKLMEINPKFWGSLDLALASGVDFPFYLCQIAQGQKLAYSEAYNRKLRYHWPLLEIQHAFMRPKSIRAVVADLLNPEVKSNICFSDIKPNLFEPFSRVRTQASRLVRERHQHYRNYPVLEKSNL